MIISFKFQEKILPRKLRTKSKSITDRFEPPNESIVCPLHGANGSTTSNGSSHNVTRQNSNSSSNSPRLTQRQISNQSTSSNGSISQQQQQNGGSISRKSSQISTQQQLNSIKSPTSSMESYESALSTTNGTSKSMSSSSSTLKSSNLAQPEEDDDLDAIGDCLGSNGVGPPAKPKFECSRFTRQALYTYRAKNHLIHYKYHEYGGTCHDLPK